MSQFSDYVLWSIDNRLNRIENRLDSLVTLVRRLALTETANQEEIMALLDDLETQVAEQTTVEESAITLLDEIHAELQAALAAGDTTRIQSVIDKLASSKQSLADAVVRNTDAAPPEEPPVEPPVEPTA